VRRRRELSGKQRRRPTPRRATFEWDSRKNRDAEATKLFLAAQARVDELECKHRGAADDEAGNQGSGNAERGSRCDLRGRGFGWSLEPDRRVLQGA
jgi:hypothetical protein